MKKLIKLRDKFDNIEEILNKKKEELRYKEEQKVINDIKIDSKAFYRYAKRKSVIKSRIGPFNIKGKLVEDTRDMCQALSKQYEGVCSQPRELITDKIFIENLLCEDNECEDKPIISDVYVDKEAVKKIIGKLNNNAAMGPDGIPVHVLKYGGDIILRAIVDITKESIKTGEIPNFLKSAWVTPIYKGKDPSDPVNY